MARRMILSVLTALLGLSALAVAQQSEMTMAEYEARLAECRGRQRAADSTRQVVEGRIAELQNEISGIQEEVASAEAEVMELGQRELRNASISRTIPSTSARTKTSPFGAVALGGGAVWASSSSRRGAPRSSSRGRPARRARTAPRTATPPGWTA